MSDENQAKAIITEIEVRSTHVDEYGHANHARYVEYLEWARFDWYEANALPFADDGIGAAVVNVNVDFRREAKRGDRLFIRTWVESIGKTSVRYGQRIDNSAGEAVCEAKVTAVAFDLQARRAAPIPPELRERLEGLMRSPEIEAAG